jgi:hypothetical protein
VDAAAKVLYPVQPMRRLAQRVTLVVYAWQENQPGTLAWVFPSLRAALRAVRALRNAAAWLIVAGERDGEAVEVAELRRSAVVLAEVGSG